LEEKTHFFSLAKNPSIHSVHYRVSERLHAVQFSMSLLHLPHVLFFFMKYPDLQVVQAAELEQE